MSRLSIGFRITRRDPGHTHFDVFAAIPAHDDLDWPDVTRGKAGSLTLRSDEFDQFVGALAAIADGGEDILHLDVYHQGESQHPCIKAGDQE